MMHQASGMHLHPLEVHGLGTNCHGHFQTVASAVVAVGRWKVGEVRAVLAQQRIGREVSTEATSRDDNGAVLLECLAVRRGAFATAHIAVLVREKPVQPWSSKGCEHVHRSSQQSLRASP